MTRKLVLGIVGACVFSGALGATAAVTVMLTHGQGIGRRIETVGDRGCRAGGGDVLPTVAVVAAVVREEVRDAMANEAVNVKIVKR